MAITELQVSNGTVYEAPDGSYVNVYKDGSAFMDINGIGMAIFFPKDSSSIMIDLLTKIETYHT